MDRRTWLSTAATMAIAITTLAGCGGDSEPSADSGSVTEPSAPATTSEPPATVSVNVELRDQGKLDALFNRDDSQCASVNTGDLISLAMENPNATGEELAAMVPRTQVTIRDADGSTIGLQELDVYGGSFTKGSGCTWTINFEDVTPSEFYAVSIERDGFEETIDAPGSLTDNTFIEFAF